MGMLIDGQWRNVERTAREGAFIRRDSAFRAVVTADASSAFPAAPDRYHLYVSLACPWASRTVILRKLKRLEAVIGMTVVSPDMLENGWTFMEPEPVNSYRYLYELYAAADPSYTGPVTVPVLWDKRTSTIVNNESSEIIRMFNHAFNKWGDASLDFYPAHLASEINALNARIYEAVNDGVYRAGFATKQAAYEAAAIPLFAMLGELEQRLAHQRFLCGSAMTEADIRLFTTLIRFDLVYYSHFKCNIRQLRDYHHLDHWLRDMYQLKGIAETVDFAQIKRHYYGSQLSVNPTGVIPIGPNIDFFYATQ